MSSIKVFGKFDLDTTLGRAGTAGPSITGKFDLDSSGLDFLVMLSADMANVILVSDSSLLVELNIF
jgi:hypothetical protein